MKKLALKSLFVLLLTLYAVMEWHTTMAVTTDQVWKDTEPKDRCQGWTVYNSTSKTCVCGDPLQGIVDCYISNNTTTVRLRACYCMSYYNNSSEVVVGRCLFTCVSFVIFDWQNLYREVKDPTDDEICSGYHRRGPVCGECEKNHAPPVYHYNFTCVECSEYKWNWLKYIAVAYFPLTIFYFLVLLLKISATTGSLNAYVTINQLAVFNGVLRFYFFHQPDPSYSNAIKLFSTVCTIWNLDFFRSVYEPFCLHPSMTTIQAFCLDYLLGIYPLLLILVTFFFVKLHDRYSVVVFLWRPFHRCLSRFSHTLNIRTSLVQAFATFILLSYVKILTISVDILTPSGVSFKPDGHAVTTRRWHYNNSLEYFSREHVPYATLAITMTFIFNLLPLALLFLYPFHCFQRFLHCLRLNSNGLRIFMDTFYGCYRIKPRDCRHFAAVYIFLRVANLLVFCATRSLVYFFYAEHLFILALVVVAIVRPYRNTWHNVADIVLFLSISMFYGVLNSQFEVNNITPQIFVETPTVIPYILISAILSIPFMYGVSIFMWWILPEFVIMKLKVTVQQKFCCPCIKQTTDGAEESLPYRLEQSTEYSPLI